MLSTLSTSRGRTRALGALRCLLPGALLCVALAPRPASAQPRDAASLARRMHAFLEAVSGTSQDSVTAFFPRSGDWTWYHTVHPDGAADRVQVWRFSPAATPEALRTCGPVWESFQFQPEGQPLGVLSSQVVDHGTRWRRVGGTRFVPPGAPVRGPVFVEWRREGGAWVVSAFGDESFRGRSLPGTVASMVRRDTTGPVPPRDVFAPGQAWYDDNEPITFQGYRYLKSGNPRADERRELAWIGMLGPVRVYGKPGDPPVPHVIYVAAAPGMFMPYRNDSAPMCQ